MRMITPQNVAFTASVTEDEIRQRMAFEAMGQIGALGADGKPLPGVKWVVHRGPSRVGGYVITITGPMPERSFLPLPDGGSDA